MEQRGGGDVFRRGKDEMNLAEFALAGIGARRLDGRKTVVFQDQVFDKKRRTYVPRELSISGSDKYGLPTAQDDDVLLACFQLTKLQGFRSRELTFSRYEVLKLLNWSLESHYYRRVKTSLRRWKGVTVYSDRNFWDGAAGGFVDRDFGIIDELRLFEPECEDHSQRRSSLIWSEFIWQSCQAGYIKDLDWQFYLALESPVAKRLYRFLDKRFWRDQSRFLFDLRELAFRHVGMSAKQDNYDLIRELGKGIAELESKWPLLVPLSKERRFRQVAHGKWEVEFLSTKASLRARTMNLTPAQAVLVGALHERGVSRAEAEKLAGQFPPTLIQTQLEAFDHRLANYAGRRPIEDGGAFLAEAIRKQFPIPAGFLSTEARAAAAGRQAERQKHLEAERAAQEAAERREAAVIATAIQEFLDALGTDEERAEFERSAAARSPFRGQYAEAKAAGGSRYERWRQVILAAAIQGRTVRHSK